MSTAKRLHYSYAEYLSSLEISPLKLEYCDGAIYAIAGGTPAHALLQRLRDRGALPCTSEGMPTVHFGSQGANRRVGPDHLSGRLRPLR